MTQKNKCRRDVSQHQQHNTARRTCALQALRGYITLHIPVQWLQVGALRHRRAANMYSHRNPTSRLPFTSLNAAKSHTPYHPTAHATHLKPTEATARSWGSIEP